MRELALSSRLFREADVTHIRNCVDPRTFNGQARHKTREELGLFSTTKAVLFSSANQPRKGAFIIPDIIRELRNQAPRDSWRFLFMGGVPPKLEPRRDIIILPRTTDEVRVASYYAASDIYALPSLEDNLPNTIGESLCCGTPVAAFPTGGIVEMVEPGLNGYLSDQSSIVSLTTAIRNVLALRFEARENISASAHEMYSPARIASLHMRLFADVISSPTADAQSSN